MSAYAEAVALHSAQASDGVPVEIGNGHHMPAKAHDHALAAGKAFKKKDAAETTRQIQQALNHNGKPVDIVYVGTSELSKKKNREDFAHAVHKLAKAEYARKTDLRAKVLSNGRMAAKSYLSANKASVGEVQFTRFMDDARKHLTVAWQSDAAYNNDIVSQELLDRRTLGIPRLGDPVIRVGGGNVEQYNAFAETFLRTLWPQAMAVQAFAPSPQSTQSAAATTNGSKYGADSDYYGGDEGEEEPLYKRIVKTPMGITAIGLVGLFGYLLWQENKRST